MADLLEVPFSGGTILFAAAGSSGPRAYTTANVIEKAQDTLEDAIEMVKSMGNAISKQMSEIQCNGAEATFGIKITGTGKFIVAEASAEASLQIKLTFAKT